MKYDIYNPEAVCRKCGYPFGQIYRVFCDGEHSIMVDDEVKKCKVKGEHLHMECACGYEFILRPLDWNYEARLAKAEKARKLAEKKVLAKETKKPKKTKPVKSTKPGKTTKKGLKK